MCNCKKKCNNCYPAYGCPVKLSTNCVNYNGSDLPTIGVTKGTNLQDALIRIDSTFRTISTGGQTGVTSLSYDQVSGVLTSVFLDGSSRTTNIPQLTALTLASNSTDVSLVNQILNLNKATQTTDGVLSKEDKIRIDQSLAIDANIVLIVTAVEAGTTTISIPNIIKSNFHYQLFRGGALELPGIGNEYVLNTTSNQIELTSPLILGEVVQFFYKY